MVYKIHYPIGRHNTGIQELSIRWQNIEGKKHCIEAENWIANTDSPEQTNQYRVTDKTRLQMFIFQVDQFQKSPIKATFGIFQLFQCNLS